MMEIDTTSSLANNIMMVEVNTGNSRVNEKRPLEMSSPAKEARKHPDTNGGNTTVLLTMAQLLGTRAEENGSVINLKDPEEEERQKIQSLAGQLLMRICSPITIAFQSQSLCPRW